MSTTESHVDIRPLTPLRWEDLVGLFGPRGPHADCWCMWLRVTQREFSAGSDGGNKAALRDLAGRRGHAPGLLAYEGSEAVGWVSVGPREEFGRITRSRTLRPVDDEPNVWSVVCFYVAKSHRGRGLVRQLSQAAVDYAFERGASAVECYPLDDTVTRVPPSEAFPGLVTLCRTAGFTEVARRSATRPVMRHRAE